VSDSEVERGRITEEIERLLGLLLALPASNPGYERYPYMRAGAHWDSIAAVIKDAAERLSLDGEPNAFASKPWLQLQLKGDRRAARHWPIDDLIRDLKFIRTILTGQTPIRTSSEDDIKHHRDASRSTQATKRHVDGQRRPRKLDPTVERIKVKVRELRADGCDFKSICARLGESERPPRATWRNLTWPVAHKLHTAAVTKWLSEACAALPSRTI
jgi:hypothetical protein